jgi:hypothetical protein
MSGLFGGGGAAAKPVVSTPPPDVSTPAVQAAADAERRRVRSNKGKASTLLTTPSGAGSANVGTTKLLGG